MNIQEKLCTRLVLCIRFAEKVVKRVKVVYDHPVHTANSNK